MVWFIIIRKSKKIILNNCYIVEVIGETESIGNDAYAGKMLLWMFVLSFDWFDKCTAIACMYLDETSCKWKGSIFHCNVYDVWIQDILPNAIQMIRSNDLEYF